MPSVFVDGMIYNDQYKRCWCLHVDGKRVYLQARRRSSNLSGNMLIVERLDPVKHFTIGEEGFALPITQHPEVGRVVRALFDEAAPEGAWCWLMQHCPERVAKLLG